MKKICRLQENILQGSVSPQLSVSPRIRILEQKRLNWMEFQKVTVLIFLKRRWLLQVSMVSFQTIVYHSKKQLSGNCKAKDKIAEYISPPRSKVPTPLDIESDPMINLDQRKQSKSEGRKLTEPIKVADLACMSSKELDEHLSGLRNNVKRLQEMECSFVAVNAVAENENSV